MHSNVPDVWKEIQFKFTVASMIDRTLGIKAAVKIRVLCSAAPDYKLSCPLASKSVYREATAGMNHKERPFFQALGTISTIG